MQYLALIVLELAKEVLAENVESNIDLLFGCLKIPDQFLLVVLNLQWEDEVLVIIMLIHQTYIRRLGEEKLILFCGLLQIPVDFLHQLLTFSEDRLFAVGARLHDALNEDLLAFLILLD